MAGELYLAFRPFALALLDDPAKVNPANAFTISADGPSHMVKRPTGSDGEPSSPNCESSAGVKARQPHSIYLCCQGLTRKALVQSPSASGVGQKTLRISFDQVLSGSLARHHHLSLSATPLATQVGFIALDTRCLIRKITCIIFIKKY